MRKIKFNQLDEYSQWGIASGFVALGISVFLFLVWIVKWFHQKL